MKKDLVLFMGVFLTLLFASGNAMGQSGDEEAIRETALNYIEGWYSADTARIAKALAPDLAKKGIVISHKTRELVVTPADYKQMLAWTAQKPNELKTDPNKSMEVVIIEVGKYIAMVKTITPDFIDYLHMGKIDGEWKIYNAIWERPYKK